ncbi:expressed unknown protein [Seminavis robusta]|uniref:Uncharacterized protein n=1 Tax=Seminavis robusta TaxID=568900 RepID=A0A9N8DGY6_9STRA|nr:expressed unknown protein [Seminavis robusta]|eukprot:Sro62_g035420.1 n/a (189) ;mRNA; f:88288-88854
MVQKDSRKNSTSFAAHAAPISFSLGFLVGIVIAQLIVALVGAPIATTGNYWMELLAVGLVMVGVASLYSVLVRGSEMDQAECKRTTTSREECVNNNKNKNLVRNVEHYFSVGAMLGIPTADVVSAMLAGQGFSLLPCHIGQLLLALMVWWFKPINMVRSGGGSESTKAEDPEEITEAATHTLVAPLLV